MTEEIWKDIKGYEGLYQVSDLGRVKSFKRDSERILKPLTKTTGYKSVTLSNKQVKHQSINVHRLVADAFIPNPDNKPQVNHIDEDKTNNMVSNLEWVTAKENANHGTAIERRKQHPNSHCNRKKIVCTTTSDEYSSISEAANELNLSAGNIINVVRGRYKQTGGYTFEYKTI